MPDTKGRRLIPRLEAAALLGGVSIATLQRMERRGQLRAIRFTSGGKVFYASEEMEGLILGDQEPPAPQAQ